MKGAVSTLELEKHAGALAQKCGAKLSSDGYVIQLQLPTRDGGWRTASYEGNFWCGALRDLVAYATQNGIDVPASTHALLVQCQ